MSKIHLQPSIGPEGVLVVPTDFKPHPTDLDAVVMYYSVERFIEHCKPAVGAILAYWSVDGSCRSYNDQELPYGTVAVGKEVKVKFTDWIAITDTGWRWLHNGSYELHLEAERLRVEAELLAAKIQACPALEKFPETTRQYFYHEGLEECM